MKIAIGCDHGGYLLKQDILIWLEEHDIDFEDVGCFSTESVDYPVYAEKVARAVAAGECDRGIVICTTGIGVSMAANKVLPMFMTDTTVTVSPSFNSIVVAFGISVGIGVLFGYLPAKRAARLNPIEALRYD